MGGMRAMKLAGIGVVVLIVAVGLGFAWGAAGRSTAQDALDDVRQKLDIAEARGSILDARVSLYNVNFGEAQRQLEEAKVPLTRARDRAKADGRTQAADDLTKALGAAQEAQRLAAKLDQSANSRAAEALKAISESSR
jgi:hypothetical protein